MRNAFEQMRDLIVTGSTDNCGILSRSNLVIGYEKWCYKKIFGAFEFSGVPVEWDFDYFITNLFMGGYVAICQTEIGVIPLICGITGINVFNRPTEAIIANAVLGNFSRNLYGDDPATDCALVKLQYDYGNVRPLVYRYSNLLAECDNSIAVNLRNSKVAFIGFVSGKKQAATVQKLYHDIDEGKPAVYIKSDDMTKDDIYFNHVKETYVAADIQLLKRQIKDDFLTEIGLNNANVDKRERLVVDEVNANNYEIKANVQHWIDTISEGLNRANDLFGLNLSVRLRRFDAMEGGAENDKTENIE